MLEDQFRRTRVLKRIRGNPIGSVLEQFVDYLIDRGHSTGTIYQYVAAAEHFGRWLGRQRISQAAVMRFCRQHLPSCRCNRPAPRKGTSTIVALHRLLDMLGCNPALPPRDSVPESLLQRYADHLRDAQGLASVTVRYRVRYARTMLSSFHIRCLDQLKRWTADDVQRFVTGQGKRYRPASGQVMASSIRSFLRFLLLHEFIDQDLASAVPSFANWRLASLPNTLQAQELERLVQAIETTSPIGLRDRAIVLCMVDLGLRACDVAGLKLNDVNPTAQRLRLKQRKQRATTDMPMTRRLAGAMNTYLRRGRPPCSSSAVFVIHRAPHGKPLTRAGVQGVVIRRASAAGLGHCIRGTHVLRHSVASRWLQSGATLKQIADLLGHRSIDTTSLYAKVDLTALAKVALPWPASKEVTS